MDIGGDDIFVEYSGEKPSNDNILNVIKTFWPELVVEYLSDHDGEFFVYKNAASKEAWDEDFSEEIDAEMIYVLNKQDCLTTVIDANRLLLPVAKAIIALAPKENQ